MTFEELLEYYENRDHRGAMLHYTHTAKAALQDSEITLFLSVNDYVIKQATYLGKGSILCQAVAAYVCQSIEGMTIEQALTYEPWADFDFQVTRPCAHLSLFALKAAFV